MDQMDLVSENGVVQKISTSRKDDIFIECCETLPKDTNIMITLNDLPNNVVKTVC